MVLLSQYIFLTLLIQFDNYVQIYNRQSKNALVNTLVNKRIKQQFIFFFTMKH